MVYRVLHIGIECKMHINPLHIEDACYALFQLMNREPTILSIDKPVCSRAIAHGENFEVRLFMKSSTGESLLMITVDCSNDIKRDVHFAVQLAEQIISKLSKYVITLEKLRIYIKSCLRIPSHKLREVIQNLQDSGVALTKVEFRDFEESYIYLISGFYIERNLRAYELNLVAMIRDNAIADTSLTISSTTTRNRLFEDLIQLTGSAKAILEVISSTLSP